MGDYSFKIPNGIITFPDNAPIYFKKDVNGTVTSIDNRDEIGIVPDNLAPVELRFRYKCFILTDD
jgi:hypothetical protein